MTSDFSRRRFLGALIAGLPVAALSRGRPGAAAPGDDPLFRISLAEWSLHRTLQSGGLTNLDFPRVARVDYELDAVEYVNQFFKDRATDRAYLADLARRAEDHGVTSLLIMCDGEGALGDADDAARGRAVENHYRWVEAAWFLGCHSIRVNAQSAGTPEEQRDRAADGLRRLTEFAAPRGINVIVENHGGLSSNGAWLASVIRRVNHPRCGTLPDFGNFRVADDEWYDRYVGVAELMPFAKAVSAKSHEFDAQGNEVRTDYERMMRIVLDAGYRGYVGIEYEGDGLSEPDGIRATKRLLERVRDRLR
jgi:sugar phosphate isomerase/epimerase